MNRLPLYFLLNSVFISTMTFAAVTNNVIMLFVIVEATTLASALLVTFYGRAESLEAGYKYLILCTVGITLALLGCVMLYASATTYLPGDKAMLITEIAKVSSYMPPHLVLIAGCLLIIGFLLTMASTVLFMISGMISTSAPQVACPSCQKVTKMLGKEDACMFCGQPLLLEDEQPQNQT